MRICLKQWHNTNACFWDNDRHAETTHKQTENKRTNNMQTPNTTHNKNDKQTILYVLSGMMIKNHVHVFGIRETEAFYIYWNNDNTYACELLLE